MSVPTGYFSNYLGKKKSFHLIGFFIKLIISGLSDGRVMKIGGHYKTHASIHMYMGGTRCGGGGAALLHRGVDELFLLLLAHCIFRGSIHWYCLGFFLGLQIFIRSCHVVFQLRPALSTSSRIGVVIPGIPEGL